MNTSNPMSWVSTASVLLVLGLRSASADVSTLVYDDFADAVLENGVLKSELDYGPAIATGGHSLSIGTLNDNALHLGGDGSRSSIHITAALPQAVSLAEPGNFIQMTFAFTTGGDHNGNRVLRYGLFQGADDDADATGYFLSGYNQADGAGSDMNSRLNVDTDAGRNHFLATDAAPGTSNMGSSLLLDEHRNVATFRVERVSEDVMHISGVHGPRDLGSHVHIITDDSAVELNEIWFGIHDRATSFTIDDLTVISGTTDVEPTGPSIRHAAKTDQSSPEATIRSLVKAMRDGDGATAASCIHGDEQDRQFVHDMAEFAGALTAFENAAKARWGEEAWAHFDDSFPDAPAIAAELETLAAMAFQAEADRAFSDNVEVVKMDGRWYLDATVDGGHLPLSENAEGGFALYSRMIEASRMAAVYREKKNRIGRDNVTAASLSKQLSKALKDTIANMSASGHYTYDASADDGTATITGYRGPGGDIIIPHELNGKTVTRIARRAFHDNRNITRVVIPGTVTHIGREAFRDGRELTTVFLPAGVISIARPAFNRCHRLLNIHVAEDNAAFSSIDGVLFNKDQTAIRRYPIARSGDYTIPDTVTTIIHEAFRFCRNLTGITIPDDVTYIGHSAFRGCSSLTRIIIPEGVTTIHRRAFKDCVGLTRMSIPDGVTTIHRRTFRGCTNLEHIRLPENLSHIREQAFYDCGNLTNITIPAGVSRLGCERGGEVFKGCDHLERIVFLGDAPSLEGRNMFPNSELTIYRLESADGWPEPGSDWENLPTALFAPPVDSRGKGERHQE